MRRSAHSDGRHPGAPLGGRADGAGGSTATLVDSGRHTPRAGRICGAAVVVLALVPLGISQQVSRENGRWVRLIQGSAPAAARLRVNAHGPVTLEGGVSNNLTYTVKLSVNARSVRSEAEARRRLRQYAVRVESEGGWTVLTTPASPAMAT